METLVEVAMAGAAPAGLVKLQVLRRGGVHLLLVVDWLYRDGRAPGFRGVPLLPRAVEGFGGCRVVLCTRALNVARELMYGCCCRCEGSAAILSEGFGLMGWRQWRTCCR